MQNLKTRRPFTVMQIMSFFYCQVRLTKVQRVDVVFVTGQENTLKSTARAKCGKRTWRKFITCSSLQNIENWLRKSEKNIYVSNRTELQEALAIGRKMVKCGCKPEKGCSGRCKALKSALMYTNSVNVTGNARQILN